MIQAASLHVIHGGHKGAEAAFGRAAEAWGISETTISFEGHAMERSRNVEVLDDATLRQGRVSMEFVFQRMGRRFVRGKGLQRVIKSMFQVVVRSDELYSVGWIQEDGTVKGGTGWGVELAKLFNRRLHVFDQGRDGWYHWTGAAWEKAEPTLVGPKVGATGTRNLSAAGKQGIRELFERSLGPAVKEEALAENAG